MTDRRIQPLKLKAPISVSVFLIVKRVGEPTIAASVRTWLKKYPRRIGPGWGVAFPEQHAPGLGNAANR